MLCDAADALSFCRPSGGDDALKNLGRAQRTRPGAGWRTHQAAGAAMQLLCDYCSVQSSTCPGTPGWDSSSGSRRAGMTEANQSTQAPRTLGKTRLLLGSITLPRLDGFDPRMARS